MPYYRKKATTTRKKKYVPKKRSLVKTIQNVVNRQAETKAKILHFTEFNYNTLNSPTGYFPLNNLAEGTEKSERVGNCVMPTRIDIRGQVQAAHQEAIWYRILVLEHNSARNPTLDLLEDSNGNFAPGATDLTAIWARINTGKYKVLGSRMLKTGTHSNTANDSNAAQMFHFNIPLRGKMYYDDAAQDCNKRQISLLAIGRRANNDEAMGLGFEFTYNSKFYFKDI